MGSEKNVDEILAAQKEFEAQQQRQKEEDEANAAHESELKVQAGDDYIAREGVRTDLKVADTELKNMESDNIEGRIAITEAKKEERLAKEEELEATNVQLSELETRFQTLEGVASQAQEKGLGISPELSEAIEELGASLEQLKGQAGAISADIEAIRTQEVPDKETQRFISVKSEVAKLDGRMKELESNPALVEMLHDEALVQNQLIDQIAATAIEKPGYGPRNYSRERNDYVQTVCIKFFQEEIASSGIDQISDKDERIAALRKLAQNIMKGLRENNSQHIFDMNRELSSSEAREQFAGLGLTNLIGVHGTGEAALTHLSSSELFPGYGSEHIELGRQQAAEVSQAKIHLGTLNFMRAYATGIGRSIAPVVMGTAYSINDLDSHYQYANELGLVIEGQPILPKDLSEQEKQAITDQFQKDLERGRGVAEQRYKTDKEANEKLLAELQEKLTSAQKEKEDLTSSKATLERHGNQYELALKIDDLKTNLASQNDKLRSLQLKLNSLGTLSFLAKRNINIDIEIASGIISNIENQLTELKTKHQEASAAHQHVNSTRESVVNNEIYHINEQIKELTRVMENNDQEYETLTKKE